MTAIIGIIGLRGSVIASDGRVFASFNKDTNGKPSSEVKIETDEYDKTFKTVNGKIIGGCAGLIRFSGKTTNEHLVDILSEYETDHYSLEKHLPEICDKFKALLESINENEVTFSARVVDIILSTYTKKDVTGFAIAAFRFSPNENKIYYNKIGETKYCSKKHKLNWTIIGDTKAADSMQIFCDRENGACTGNPNYGFILSLAKRSNKKGNDNSSDYYNSGHQSCGGATFVQGINGG